jgi:hypothetical protein
MGLSGVIFAAVGAFTGLPPLLASKFDNQATWLWKALPSRQKANVFGGPGGPTIAGGGGSAQAKHTATRMPAQRRRALRIIDGSPRQSLFCDLLASVGNETIAINYALLFYLIQRF